MASGSPQGHIAFWDLERRQIVTQQRHVHGTAVAAATFLHGEPLLITTGADNAIKVNWPPAVSSGFGLPSLSLNVGFSFSPFMSPSFQIWIFDQEGGGARLLRSRQGHSAPPTTIRHHGNDGKNILSAGKSLLMSLQNSNLDSGFVHQVGSTLLFAVQVRTGRCSHSLAAMSVSTRTSVTVSDPSVSLGAPHGCSSGSLIKAAVCFGSGSVNKKKEKKKKSGVSYEELRLPAITAFTSGATHAGATRHRPGRLLSKRHWSCVSPAATARESDWDGIVACHRGRSIATTWNYQRCSMGAHHLQPPAPRRDAVATVILLSIIFSWLRPSLH